MTVAFGLGIWLWDLWSDDLRLRDLGLRLPLSFRTRSPPYISFSLSDKQSSQLPTTPSLVNSTGRGEKAKMQSFYSARHSGNFNDGISCDRMPFFSSSSGSSKCLVRLRCTNWPLLNSRPFTTLKYTLELGVQSSACAQTILVG